MGTLYPRAVSEVFIQKEKRKNLGNIFRDTIKSRAFMKMLKRIYA